MPDDSRCWHLCGKRIGGCGKDFFHIDNSHTTVLDEWQKLCPECVEKGVVAKTKSRVARNGLDEGRSAEGRIQPTEICCGAGSTNELTGEVGDYEHLSWGNPQLDGSRELRKVAQAARSVQSEL